MKLYSLAFYDDEERLTVEGKTVTVPLFYATSTAVDFLRHLDQPWKIDAEDGAALCTIDKEPGPFDWEEAKKDLLADGDRPESGAGTESETLTGEAGAGLEPGPIQDGLLMGWKFRQVDGIEFTITFDYQGADEPYRMPPKLARNRTAKPFFHSDAELLSLYAAVNYWLVPRVGERRPRTYLKPSQQVLAGSVQIPDDPDIHKRLAAIQAEYEFEAVDRQYHLLWLQTYMEGIFHHRTCSAGAEIMLISDGPHRKQVSALYKSESFLALAWVEILWAIRHGIYAQICENCGAVFRLGGP
ncbi:MAG: hypothetical protein ABRQ24_09310, partial [Syntrophomonadaceae bacterium]